MKVELSSPQNLSYRWGMGNRFGPVGYPCPHSASQLWLVGESTRLWGSCPTHLSKYLVNHSTRGVANPMLGKVPSLRLAMLPPSGISYMGHADTQAGLNSSVQQLKGSDFNHAFCRYHLHDWVLHRELGPTADPVLSLSAPHLMSHMGAGGCGLGNMTSRTKSGQWAAETSPLP